MPNIYNDACGGVMHGVCGGAARAAFIAVEHCYADIKARRGAAAGRAWCAEPASATCAGSGIIIFSPHGGRTPMGEPHAVHYGQHRHCGMPRPSTTLYVHIPLWRFCTNLPPPLPGHPSFTSFFKAAHRPNLTSMHKQTRRSCAFASPVPATAPPLSAQYSLPFLFMFN